MSTLRDRIEIALRDSGLTQAELARAVGLKPPSIHGWLSGKARFLKGENLLAAAAALRVDSQWLATGEGAAKRGAHLPESDTSPLVTPEPVAPATAERQEDFVTWLRERMVAADPATREAVGHMLMRYVSAPDNGAMERALRAMLDGK